MAVGNVDRSVIWDDRWIDRLKQLEPAMWERLIDTYADALRQDIANSLRRRGLAPELIDDVQQETWCIAVQKIDEFVWETADKLYHWLRVIALNQVRMLTRQHSPAYSLDDFDTSSLDKGLSLDAFLYIQNLSTGDPEQLLLLRERLTALDGALRELKPRDREILLRRVLEGETPRQIAALYHLEARTVSMILLRAKQTLERHVAALTLFKGDFS